MAQDFKVRALIEGAAVAAVVMSLVLVLLDRLESARSQANFIKAKAEIRLIKAGLDLYHIANLGRGFPSSTDGICKSVLLKEPSPVMPNVLMDPFAQPAAEYRYFRSESGKRYVVFSVGDDGISGIKGIDDHGRLLGNVGDDIYLIN